MSEESSENISNPKVSEEKQTPPVVESPDSNEDIQPSSSRQLEQEQSDKSSQDLCDVKSVNIEPEVITSSEIESPLSPLGTKPDNFDATTSKRNICCSLDFENASEYPVHKKPRLESIQDSSDIPSVNSEPKAGTSKEGEILPSLVCSKAGDSDAASSKSDNCHSIDTESSSVNHEENVKFNESGAKSDACHSMDIESSSENYEENASTYENGAKSDTMDIERSSENNEENASTYENGAKSDTMDIESSSENNKENASTYENGAKSDTMDIESSSENNKENASTYKKNAKSDTMNIKRASENSKENSRNHENGARRFIRRSNSTTVYTPVNSRVQISPHDVHTALQSEYDNMRARSEFFHSENSSDSLQNPGCSIQPESNASINSQSSSNMASHSAHEEGNLENARPIQRHPVLERTDYFTSQNGKWTDIRYSQVLLDNLNNHYSNGQLEQAAVILINRISETFNDMKKLFKEMNKKPHWRRMVRKGYNVCGYEASRNVRYRINERISRDVLIDWSDIEFRLILLSYYLKEAILFAHNATLREELLISVYGIREMILVILRNDGLRDISSIFDYIPTALRLNDDIRYVLDVRQLAASIIAKLLSILSHIERLYGISPTF